MSVRDEITRLETAKSDIETAIETCGVNVPDTEKISAYASYIRQIPSAIFSELNAGPFGGEDAFIRTIEQTDGVIEATTGGLVSSSLSGLAPKIGTASSATISKQADEWVLTSTKGATPTWRKLPVNAFKNDNDNTTYTLSGALDGNTFVSTLTPSSGSPTTATVPAMGAASDSAAGTAGLVPAPAKNNEGKFLRGDGTWAIPSKSENSYYLYTQYQNSTDFYPNYKAYLKWIANDVAAFHFTDGTYKFKANLADSVPWTGVTGRPTALSEFTDDILANHYLPLSGGQLTGNLTLYAGSGNSPYIRFQRGSNKADTLCDWTIVDEGGYLIFREGVNGAEEDVLKICGSANTSAFTGSVSAASFVGSLTGNASSSTYATYLGTKDSNYSKSSLDSALADRYSYSTSRTKNTVLAAPNGSDGSATFRALVAADLPSHNHSSAQITSLTSYTKATKNGSLATTDTLNSALGKLEYKADLGKSAYDIISAAYDGDGVIENLTEILKVLEGISDTDTITSIIGKYLPLTGGSLSSEAYISWTDRGAWGNSSAVYPYSYGGLSWSGTSDWIKLYGKEESSDKLNLIIEFGDDSGHDIKLIDNGTERIVMHSGNYTSYTVEKDGTGATGTWAIDISGNAATATNAGNADTLDSYHANTGHTPFGKIPTIATDGVMEIGKYIDFHHDNTASKDYSTRLYCQGEYGNSVKLPTTNGTLALTSQIPSTLANPEALTIFGVAYDGSAAKTVTATTMISTLTEGTSDVTDKTEILTSYASDNGFADSAAQNVVYKRKANKLYNYINKKLKDDHAGLDKVGTVTSVTVTGDNGLSGTGTITTSGTITLSNAGVRSLVVGTDNNANKLAVNTGGTTSYLTVPFATNSTKASYLHYDNIGGGSSDTHDSVLKSYFNSNKSSIPRNSLLGMYSGAYGNGSYYMGYFLSGYDSSPYGGFFVAHYANPYYVGISNGSYTTQHILTSTNYTDYTVKKDGTGATGTWGIDISGNAATATTAESTTKLARAGYLESDSAIDNFLEANTFKYALFKTTSANKVAMASNDGMLLSIPWSSTTYGFQLAFDDTTNCVMKGRGKATNWGSWHTFIHSGNYTSYVNETNFPGINKTGTVTKVSTGTGLTGGDVTTTGTIKCNLSKETSLGTLGSTSKLYAVGVDANGKLCVKVPWEKGLASESDPVFSASAAAGITAADIANWNSKTSNTGDITGVTAGDGLTGGATSGTATLNVGAGTGISVAADTVSISSAYQTKISNGVTAYGWGNHADAGYLDHHQTIYSLTIKNSAGTEQLTYTPNSDAGSITLTKAMVGLGNVDNTADADKTVAVANKLGTATKGSVTKPIYLSSGSATECNTYAGGTAVTLNGSSKAASTASFYAPTGFGTSGYLLQSNGSSAPTWTNTIGSSTTALGTSYITNMYADALYLKSYYPTSGDIYISGFTTVPDSTSRVRLYTARYALIKNNNNSSACAIYAPGGFYESSDERLKQLLNPLQVSLDDICKLRKIYYTWKDDPNSGRQLGVVAQDVQKLYPELVDINTDTGYLSLAYDKLSVIALGAIDKLYEIFKKLSLENESLKNRLENLEKLI